MRYFYKGTDPGTLDAEQLEGLLRHIMSIRNMEKGKPAEGDWFDRHAKAGTVRKIIG